MKRKYLFLISIFIVFSILLTGCGNEGSNLSGTESNNPDIVSVVSVNSFSSDEVIKVDYGTSKANALPQEVSANLSSGDEVEIPVDWDKGTPDYNREQVGTYKFIGSLNLSGLNYKNPDNISLDAVVEVMPPELGSIYKPAQIGEEINFSFDSGDYGEVILTLEITEIIVGDQAKDVIIEKRDKFLPKLGKEYILVEYNFTLESVEEESSSFSLSLDAFDAISKTEGSYDNLLSGIDNELYTNLNVGSTVSGYAAYSADILNEPYAVLNEVIWFDISR